MKWPVDVKVAVNLSPAQFRSRNLVQAVISALAHSGLSPKRLELEITELVFLAETEANLAILHQLRELGVSISMDDFGTGYSSLSYLRSFPFDKIKIDRSFVKDLAERPDCVAIVRAISGLGRSLNITTTAEGVETEDQLDWLRAEGCNEVQGFLFSAARPASEIATLLAGLPSAPQGRRSGQNRVTISDSAGRGRSSLGFDGVPIWMKPASLSSAFSPNPSSTSRSKANQPVSQLAP